jgi:invasion protein IalB
VATQAPIALMRFAAAVAIAVLLIAGARSAGAQQQGPSDAAKAMVGAWELSNADRDKTCTITFKIGAAAANYPLDLAKGCTDTFPPIRAAVAWTFGRNDMLVLLDAKGASLLELLEVEAGMYEGLRPNEGRYFLQNAAVAAAQKDKTADQMFGDWAFARGTGNSRPICSITLENTAKDADTFALTVKAGCDQLITRFGPAGWKMDRGQLIVVSAKGELWRFEEGDTPSTWSRVPVARQPLSLVKQ